MLLFRFSLCRLLIYYCFDIIELIDIIELMRLGVMNYSDSSLYMDFVLKDISELSDM